MRWGFIALVTVGLAVAPIPGRATAPTDVVPRDDPSVAIRQIIERQLAAFNAENTELAFSFAAPMIQRMFGTPEKFGAMVERQYSAIRHSSGAVFLDLRQVQGRFIQRVRVLGTDGAIMTASFVMMQLFDGSWRIGSVLIDNPEPPAFKPNIKLGPPGS